jgi:hypothetical protein
VAGVIIFPSKADAGKETSKFSSRSCPQAKTSTYLDAHTLGQAQRRLGLACIGMKAG